MTYQFRFLIPILFIIFFGIFAYNTMRISSSLQREFGHSLPSIDYILIKKKARLLETYSKHQLVKSYNIALGSSPVGHKEKEGDGKTPEGIYKIILKNPKSSYHLSLKISYPSSQDIANAKALNLNPGSNIMIHGIKNGFGWIGKYHSMLDWTRGCIAVSNLEIEEIYSTIQIGSVVEIRP
jgi:murein L,D-transpeptidase YafK